jgi:hypothetical protein
MKEGRKEGREEGRCNNEGRKMKDNEVMKEGR